MYSLELYAPQSRPLGLIGFGLVTMRKMRTMVAGEKEAVWIHHDRRPSVEMPTRGLLNEGTSRDGDRDNERPLDS